MLAMPGSAGLMFLVLRVPPTPFGTAATVRTGAGLAAMICVSAASVSPVASVEKLNETTTVAGDTPIAAPMPRCAKVSLQIAFRVALVIGVHVGVEAPAWISLIAWSRTVW